MVTCTCVSTVIASAFVDVCCVAEESRTFNENENGPEAVGDPEIVPFEEFSVSPAGRLPDAMLQL